jgi:hypothetical protein
MVYTKGVEVGTGVSTTTNTLGVNVGLGIGLGDGSAVSAVSMEAGCVSAGAQAARRKINRSNNFRIR